MHDEENGWVRVGVLGRDPVERDMPSVLEEKLLSLEIGWKEGFGDVVDRL